MRWDRSFCVYNQCNSGQLLQWKFHIDFRLKIIRALFDEILILRETQKELHNLKSSFSWWRGNFMWLDIGIGLFRQSGVESKTLVIILNLLLLPLCWQKVVLYGVSMCISIVPNQNLFCPVFLSYALQVIHFMQNSSPPYWVHLWRDLLLSCYLHISDQCPISSPASTFCFCSPASTTDIILRNVCCLKFCNHGWTGGSKKGPEY